jgi:hypothetical protein
MSTSNAKAPKWRTRVPGPRLGLDALALLLAACRAPVPASSSPASPAAPTPHLSDELRRARAFDQQGVLAFEAGRYHDALLYFDAAFAHGGPPSERWNSAKCHLHLDEPDQAETDLTAYLALSGLSPDDKREAESALEGIRRRPSTLTVISTPLGLPVTVGGRRLGVTPLSVQVYPGEHIVVVERDPGARDERRVTARLGRAIIVEARP